MFDDHVYQEHFIIIIIIINIILINEETNDDYYTITQLHYISNQIAENDSRTNSCKYILVGIFIFYFNHLTFLLFAIITSN